MLPDPATAEDLRSVLRHACAELESRLRAGEDCRAEQFFEAYPALASDPEQALELIQAEWLARKALGQGGSSEEWLVRFPQWRDSLQRWLEHDAVPLGTTDGGARTIPQHGGHVAARDEPPPDPGQSLDDLRILGELGRGGMGVVYRAWDPTLKREVALKKLRAGALATPEQVRRFYREARAAARLRHPNLVPIHGMGLHQGEHCFTMPLLTGGCLAQAGARFGGDTRAAVAFVEKVARAVQVAHEAGIVHRDLKPANVLLDERGEPLVSDFGLAKYTDAGAEETLGGQVLGTPAYMAPEQAAGRVHDIRPATDVWALGVILYELLTGRRPFVGETAEEVIARVLGEGPSRPRSLEPGLDAALEAVVLKCLEKEAPWRYATAGELADDLRRWQAGEPLGARLRPWRQRLWRPFGRHTGSAKAAALLLGLVLVVGGLLAVYPPAAPPPSEPPRQQQALAALQRDLAAGKAVTLVGPKGVPEWYQWRTEKARPRLPPQHNFPLDVESWSICLFELLPAAPPRFHLSGEVKLVATNSGSAGLYLFGEERLTPDGPEHHFCGVTIQRADQGSAAWGAVAGWGAVAAGQPANGRFQMFFARYREIDRDRPQDESWLVPRRAAVPLGRPGYDDWCLFDVEATPDLLTVRLNGRLLCSLPRGEQDRHVHLWWRAVLHPGIANPPPPPPYAPGGGLGLFVERGTAQFRNVIVEPLPGR